MHYMDPAYELALKLMGKDPDADENYEEDIQDKVDEFLYERYSIDDPYKFETLVRDLAKLANRATSPLTHTIFTGFGDREKQMWLYKVEEKKENKKTNKK